MKKINHEYYVSREVSKLLKKTWFDWKVNHSYPNCEALDNSCSGYMEDLSFYHNLNDGKYGGISVPTLEVAQRWLREVKNCYVGVEVFVHNLDKNNIYYTYNWIVYLDGDRYSGSDIDTTRYYEVAQESGIKKALELILEKGE